VEDFCLNPDWGNGCHNPQPPNTPNVHWQSQVGSFCDIERGNCIIDFAVRTEGLEKDMDIVVSSINAGRKKEYPPLPMFSSTKASINRQKDKNRLLEVGDKMKRQPCATRLQWWYGPDFDLLGYPRPG
jgi:hypothetical protein